MISSTHTQNIKCDKCGRYTQVTWAGGDKPPMCTCSDTIENRLIRIEDKVDRLVGAIEVLNK